MCNQGREALLPPPRMLWLCVVVMMSRGETKGEPIFQEVELANEPCEVP